ncbi:coiled-coil domain-containing protein 134-like [Uranotaenia lowii]|uniref:coiled-coil domain-containing protein 134-like n=1 Tax=Uranotaenia lowii TaxID=190385 RepID=UPI0024784216|nr:coiled-coil domain-containing protein 134-like [Uranotaenia lowii]
MICNTWKNIRKGIPMFVAVVLCCMINRVHAEETITTSDKTQLIMNEKIYSNIFVRKREEQKLVVKHLLSTEEYSKRYDLLSLALKEILRLTQEDGEKLRLANISSDVDFPKETELAEALARYLENSCFFGELILHLPDMSYRVLKTHDGWRDRVLEALHFTRSFVQILDQKSLELLGLLEQEIDESKRSDTYVNPYREKAPEKESNRAASKTSKMPKAKLKKGPQLAGGKTEL